MKLFNFFKPNIEWKNSSWEVRLNAIEKIDDQKILKKIAVNDRDERVAIKALTNLASQLDIFNVINLVTNINVKKSAAERLTDKGLLNAFAEEYPYNPTGAIIIEKLLKLDPDHEKTLAFISINANDILFQEAAVEELKDQNWISSVAVLTKSSLIRDKAIEKLDQVGILETIFKTESDYQTVKMRSIIRKKIEDAGEKVNYTDEDPNVFQSYEIYCKAWGKLKNIEIKEIILGNKEVPSAPISEVPNFKFKKDDAYFGLTSIHTDWTRRRNEELREMIKKETIIKNVVLIDNTTPDDNWIVNKSNKEVTIACSEMYGSFTIDLKPGEIRRITFNVRANVYPIGKYFYDDLKYVMGKCEKWEVKDEKDELVLFKVED